MTDILSLLEPGDYPPEAETDLSLAALLSLATSAKRIADMMAGGTTLPVAPSAPTKRRIGGGSPAPAPAAPPKAAAAPSSASLAAGKPIPAEPVHVPADFIRHDGGKMPFADPLQQLTAIWRNDTIHEGAAQTFLWKWNGEQPKAHEILAYRLAPRDPAESDRPLASLHVPMPARGLDEDDDV